MLKIKNIFIFILIISLLLSVTSCNKSYQDAVIYFELPEKPVTLDPQIASKDSELIIIKNIFEGLLRKNSSGAIVCGVASDFTKNGLTYSFTLRDNLIWSNKEALTSHDFVFAFKRAVSPETKAPFASRLFCIENAEKIYNGKLSPDLLGVSAPDDKTVNIKLIRDDSDFENTLTTSIAMPCNEKLFIQSSGKYGLTSECTISNGSYRLTKWNKDSFGIRLYNNEKYNGTMVSKNYAAFFTCDDKESSIDKLIKNSVDIAFIDCSESEKAKSKKLKTVDFQNICWILTISSDFSPDLRKSLAMLIGNEVYGNDLLNGYSMAVSLFPSSVCKDTTSSGITAYNSVLSKQLFSKEINKYPDKRFPSSVKLYYYDNGFIKPVITDIVGHWQNNLGAFVNIESVDNDEKLISQLYNQDLNMSVFPVKADTQKLSEYLQKFNYNYNGESPQDIQTKLLKSNNIIPIAFQNTTIAYSQSLSDLSFNFGDGYIDLSFIVKAE